MRKRTWLGRTWFSEKHTDVVKKIDNPRPKKWFIFASETGVFNFRPNILKVKNKPESLKKKLNLKKERNNYIYDYVGKIKSNEPLL